MENINELALDFSLKKVYTIDGHPLYTSNKMEKRFLQILKNTPKARSNFNNYIKLINLNKLVPCYYTKVFLRVFELELKNLPEEARKIFGLYSSSNKKAFILLDQNLNPNKNMPFIIDTINHELVHMFANEHSKEFMDLFSIQLVKFYSTLFTKIFKLKDVPDDKVKEVVELFFDMFEIEGYINFRHVYDFMYENFYKYCIEIKKDDNNETNFLSEILNRYLTVIYIMAKHGFSEVRRARDKFKDILDPIAETYKEVFKMSSNSFYIQELIVPSEVICIYSERPKSLVIDKMINRLVNSRKL